MRIAQVAPLYESVPPQAYGGTERVVSYLTEELVELGHEVTLFASGDSTTSARLEAICPHSLRLDEEAADHLAHHMLLLDRVARLADQFDLIHFHVDYLHFPLSRQLEWPHLTTLHGRLDLPDLQPVYDEFDDMPVVSISDAQRRPLPQANWIGTVHHGLPLRPKQSLPHPESYFLFLGRISPEKRPDRAIAIAKEAGVPLKIAAKVDAVDRRYFEAEISPLLRDPAVDYIGEVGDAQKWDLLSRAKALLFPIDWPEPFGLVMIEAISCGTPVVAFNHGSVPEIVEPGKTGFIVESTEEALDAITRLSDLDREHCRKIGRARFSSRRMAHDYLQVYDHVLNSLETSSTQ